MTSIKLTTITNAFDADFAIHFSKCPITSTAIMFVAKIELKTYTHELFLLREKRCFKKCFVQ